MTTYAWPASVAANNVGVVLTFPDWSDLSVDGANLPEVILRATNSLSAAVSRRIVDKSTIPNPSDLGPNQIWIAITADAAARLEGYIEERQAKMFQQNNDLRQAHDNRRMAYLNDFRARNEPSVRMIEYCNEAATEFVAIGIRFCYILNAGGLIAVPAIMEIFAPGEGVGMTVPGSALLWPAILFASGILLGVATNYCAYQSMFIAAEAWTHESAASAKETSTAYYPPENPTNQQNEIVQERLNHQTKLQLAMRWANIGRLTFGGAVLAFLFGVGFAIYAIWQSSSPAGP